uniref:Uncharacterized protein n=1 Tax=viral metagenome TaxID=1070528 RepID=A0A6C0BCA2_9ZZZZ
MAFEERIIPAMLVVIIVVALLIYAFYSNFLSTQELIIKENVCRGDYSSLSGRINNIHSKSPKIKLKSRDINDDSYNNDFNSISSPLSHKNLNINSLTKKDNKSNPLEEESQNYSPGTIYITGSTNIPENVNNLTLVELEGDFIYTVCLPSPSRKGLIINIWNNSSEVKNIKSSVSFKIDGLSRSQMITLTSNNILCLQSNGKYWIQLEKNNYNDNEEIIAHKVKEQIDESFKETKDQLEDEILFLKEKFFNSFKEDKDLYNKIINDKIRNFEDNIKCKLSSIDINNFEKMIINKINSSLNNKNNDDLIDIITDEISTIKNKIDLMKTNIQSEIMEFLKTDNNYLRNRLNQLVDEAKEFVHSELQDKVNNIIPNQIKNIFENAKETIENNITSKVNNKVNRVKLNLNNYLSTVTDNLKLYFDELVNKINADIQNIEYRIQSYVESSILEIQQQLSVQIDNIKSTIDVSINNQILKIQNQIEDIRNSIRTEIKNNKDNINEELSLIKSSISYQLNNVISSLKNQVTLKITDVKDLLQSQLNEEKENIQNMIEDQKNTIDNQLEVIKTRIDSQQSYIQSQISFLKSSVISKQSNLENEYLTLSQDLDNLKNQISLFQQNIKTGTLTVNNIDVNSINLSGTINRITLTNTSSSALAIWSDSSGNTFIGTNYLVNNSNVYNNNTGIGALIFSNASMTYGGNTAVGSNCLRNSTGDYNTVVGENISGFTSTGSAFFGYEAGIGTNGNYNTNIGYASGYGQSGNYNSLFGANTSVAASSTNTPYSNSTAIGANAQITDSDQIVLGGSSNGVYPLVQIPGSLQLTSGYITGGLSNYGYIVTCDSNGNISNIPSPSSLSQISLNVYGVVLFPGSKFILYTVSSYGGVSYSFDNSTGTAPLFIPVSSISDITLEIGTNTTVVNSIQVYYLSNLINLIV